MRDTTLTSPEMHMERSRSMFLYEISCLLGKYNWPKIFYLFYFIIIIYFNLLFILFYYYYYFILFYFILLIIYFLESQACLRFELQAKTSTGNDSRVLFFFSPINLWQRLVWSSDLGNLKPKQNIRVNLSSLANGLSKKIDEISGWKNLCKHHSRIQSFIHFKTAISIPCIRSSVHPCK